MYQTYLFSCSSSLNKLINFSFNKSTFTCVIFSMAILFNPFKLSFILLWKLLSFSFGVLLVFYVLFGVFRCCFCPGWRIISLLQSYVLPKTFTFSSHFLCNDYTSLPHVFACTFYIFFTIYFIFYFILSILYTIFKFIVNLDFFDIGISFNLN